MEDKKNKKLVSRRDFLIAGGAVIAAGALTACTPKTTTETVTSTLTSTKTVTNTTTQTAAAQTTTVTGAAVTTTKTATSTVTAPVQTTTVTGAAVTTTKTATTTATTTAPGTTVTGAPVTTTVTATAQPWMPAKWDFEADVVVVGYGGAGAVAAITANDAGAKVIIMEKAPYRGGGNTGFCMGQWVCPTKVSDAFAYLKAGSLGYTPDDVIQAWAEEVCKNSAFFDSMGIKYKPASNIAGYPSLPYFSSMTLFETEGQGVGLFTALDKLVQDRKIQILFGTPGKELIQNPNTKEILGVWGQVVSGTWGKEKPGVMVAVKAKRAVVLTTGGFEFNEEMKKRFHKAYPTAFYGWRYNTGDGITMAQKVGADLWHLDIMAGTSNAVFGDVDPNYNFQIQCSPKTQNYLYVDGLGRRFINERSSLASNPHTGFWQFFGWDEAAVGYTRTPYWLIFDSVAFKAGALGPIKGTPGLRGLTLIPEELGGYAGWSSDNVAELNKGWIRKGNTIVELANNINKSDYGKRVNADNLYAAINRYNELCAKQNDDDFGRPANTLLPLIMPPYYAFPKVPGGICTHGGPRRSAKAEILTPDLTPIPRLYSAGEFGSVYGGTYSTTGGNGGELSAFGRIAGRNAAAMKPWA
jgi:hypothetical protein